MIPSLTLSAYSSVVTLIGEYTLAPSPMSKISKFLSSGYETLIGKVEPITTVHLTHGFSAGDNGFEIPLYYMLFLAIFASFGAGKLSLDHLLFGEEQ